MKIYNKFVESKKEPLNKNDIWFDGSNVRLYKEGEWYSITLSKEEVEQLLQHTGNADWNAQKGEPGYIENKPFYTDINIPIVQYNGGAIDNDRLEINVGLFDRFVIRTPYDFIEIKNGTEYDFTDNPLPTPIPNVEIVYIQYKNEWIYIESSDIDYNLPLINWINTEWYGGPYTSDIVKMPQYFIPDTVIKTVPQTLSDTAKNQALANLGIDPIVWKYMCNPIDINPILHSVDLDGNEDILGEKYRPENYGCEVYKFKPNVCAGMFRQIYHPTKTLGELWNISYINHDEGMITFSGPGGDEIMFAVIDDGERIIWHEVDW